MKKFVFLPMALLLLMLGACSPAIAGQGYTGSYQTSCVFVEQPVCVNCHYQSSCVQQSCFQTSYALKAQTICEQKASYGAMRNARGHVMQNMGYGEGRFEGCGWGSTPQQALNSCCYSGRGGKGPAKRCIAEAVRRGPRGRYYAVRIYQ